MVVTLCSTRIVFILITDGSSTNVSYVIYLTNLRHTIEVFLYVDRHTLVPLLYEPSPTLFILPGTFFIVDLEFFSDLQWTHFFPLPVSLSSRLHFVDPCTTFYT